jgi:hypothetical protein
VELFEAIQVVSSCALRYYIALKSTRFQLRIVVDVAQCQAAFSISLSPQIQKSSGFIKIQTIFSGNNGNLPLLQRH